MSNAKTVSTGVSQRAKKSQTVYKPVLDNPLSIQWPIIPPNVQNSFLGAMVDLLSCLKDYHMQRHRHVKKGKRSARKKTKQKKIQHVVEAASTKKRKASDDEGVSTPSKRRKLESDVSMKIPTPLHIPEGDTATESPPEAPEILNYVKFGLNEAAKSLEQYISKLRQSLLVETPLTDDVVTPRVMFACRWDVNPPDLFSHIPHLVASANTLGTIYDAKFPSARSTIEIKLVNLAKGSENSLSEAVGIRRLSMVTLNSKTTMGPRLVALLDKVPRLATPWLIPTTNPTILVPSLQPTHIKHVKTTAPTDLRVVKQERAKAKKEARQGRKKSKPDPEQGISATDMSIDLPSGK